MLILQDGGLRNESETEKMGLSVGFFFFFSSAQEIFGNYNS
jgi:hypothetical protein